MAKLLNNIEDELKELNRAVANPHTCDEKECENCDFYDICRATKAPIPNKDEKSEVSRVVNTLTKEQKQAVYSLTGVIRINAVAGAGKTTVIALRCALLISKGVKPEDIILLTFSNKAAEEMRDRVAGYLDALGCETDVSKLHCQTFHSYGNDIIERDYKKLGYHKVPRLIDAIEQKRIVAGLLEDNYIEGLDYKNFLMTMPNAKGALMNAIEVIQYVKENNIYPGDSGIEKVISSGLLSRSIKLLHVNAYENKLENKQLRGVAEKLIDLTYEYQELLKNLNLIDYIDQESALTKLAELNPYVFEEQGFKHVICDEFQDTNETQFKIIKGLSDNKENQSLMVVGDDLQSIYAFRGSAPEYIIKFYELLGRQGTDIDLVDNFRSSGNIIEFANSVTKKITSKVPKKLVPNKDDGEPVKVIGLMDKKNEPKIIAREVKNFIDKGYKKEDIAVICFKNSELQKIGSELTDMGIEWNTLNPEKYLENSRVNAAIALTYLYFDEEDSAGALSYLNAKADMELLTMFTDDSINKQVEDLQKKMAIIRNNKSVKAFMKLLEDLGGEDEIYDSFLEKIKNQATNLNKLTAYIRDFNTYGDTEKVKRELEYSGVILTTAHSSKGLEFPVVINSISSYTSANARACNEEWRLFFVSATRAREELVVTTKLYSDTRKKNRYYMGWDVKCLADGLGTNAVALTH